MWCSVVQCSAVQCGVVQCGVVRLLVRTPNFTFDTVPFCCCVVLYCAGESK